MFNIHDFFEIQGERVVVNLYILTIPKLKAVYEYYRDQELDPIPPLTYLAYRYSIVGPYADIEEDEKEEVILRDFSGDYTLEDPPMADACTFLQNRLTTVMLYYQNQKKLMERLSKYGATAEIEKGRDGNISALHTQLKSAPGILEDFRKLEKVVREDVEEIRRQKAKGKQEVGYDE